MFVISNKKEDLRLEDIQSLLRQTHWANTRPLEQILRSIEHSECYGVYLKDTGRQIAFARVVTDYVSMFYLSDVVVAKDWRGKGIGKAMVSAITEDQRFRDLRGILVTTYAHGFYDHFGFTPATDRYLIRERKEDREQFTANREQ